MGLFEKYCIKDVVALRREVVEACWKTMDKWSLLGGCYFQVVFLEALSSLLQPYDVIYTYSEHVIFRSY